MAFAPDMIVALIARIREKANRFIAAELERHGLEGLKPIHGDILLALFRYDAPTMKELAELVDRKKSTVTTLVEKLVRLGYAVKRQDEADCRAYRISLTEEGRALRQPLIDISDRLMRKVYKQMPAAERKRLVRGLTKINDGW